MIISVHIYVVLHRQSLVYWNTMRREFKIIVHVNAQISIHVLYCFIIYT